MDFLRRHQATLDLGQNILVIGNDTIPLSTVESQLGKARLHHNITIAPESIMFLTLKCHGRFQAPRDCALQVSTASSKLLDREPGLFLMNTVSNVIDENLTPAILINTTGKSFKFRKGNVFGQISLVKNDSKHVQSIDVVPGCKPGDIPTTPLAETMTTDQQRPETFDSDVREKALMTPTRHHDNSLIHTKHLTVSTTRTIDQQTMLTRNMTYLNSILPVTVSMNFTANS